MRSEAVFHRVFSFSSGIFVCYRATATRRHHGQQRCRHGLAQQVHGHLYVRESAGRRSPCDMTISLPFAAPRSPSMPSSPASRLVRRRHLHAQRVLIFIYRRLCPHLQALQEDLRTAHLPHQTGVRRHLDFCPQRVSLVSLSSTSLRSHRAKPLPRGLLGWIPTIIHADTYQIIANNGLDAYMFVRFLTLMLWIFAPFTLVSWLNPLARRCRQIRWHLDRH